MKTLSVAMISGIAALVLGGSIAVFGHIASAQAETFVRFEHEGVTSFGVLDEQTISERSGDMFGASKPSGRTFQRNSVRLLPPSAASKVFAVGMNFASHISSASDAPPPLFLKLPTSLAGDGQNIVLPEDATNVHFEGELVLVIGKRASKISQAEVPAHIFGVTAGNDLTERSWQGRDLQWMRSKATDGFGPVGPAVVTGLNYNDLLLTTKLNGEIVQQESTKNMIHKPAKVVSYLSQYFTLLPGDMIFMGTPGRTKSLSDGDVVTVTVEGVGTLSNKIVRLK